VAWAAGYIPRWFAHPKTVTCPSINQAGRRVTSLIRQTVTIWRLLKVMKCPLKVICFEEMKIDISNYVINRVIEKNCKVKW